MIDHDQLFKLLLTTFFIEFLELFFPEVAAYIEPGSLVALDKELYSDVVEGENFSADILMQARFKGKQTWFLIHVEPQSYQEAEFQDRMFRYFALIYLKHHQPVYPIALFSYDYPLRREPDNFTIAFPNKRVLDFSYDVIQLNRLNWRDFLNRPNPVASALMAKMRIAPKDRPKVKLACLRMLVGLKLNPVQKRFISGFVDTYLNLNPAQQQEFQVSLGKIPGNEKEEVMDVITTSWMNQGIEKGREQGEFELLIRLLKHRFGELGPELEAQVKALSRGQIEDLGIAMLDFKSRDELVNWLENQ